MGRALTWLTLVVCAMAPTLVAVVALTWYATADDHLMQQVVSQIHLWTTLITLIGLALGPWWALAYVLWANDYSRQPAA